MQHCGVCSAISDLVRRIMCLGGSRRGSGESYYQELDDEESRRGAISVDRSDPNVVYVRMAGPVGAPTRSRQFSEADWLLLETLDTRYQRPLHTGRFLTMHKRRRKRLTTRSLAQEPGLLDDIHHGQVQCLLTKVSEWPFNAFALDNVTGGRSLPVLCVHLFHWYGLLDHFHLEVVRVWKLFTLIEEGYHSTNPYHNAIHATDVTQAMHCFLQEEKIRQHLTPLEIMSSLVAAVTHDLDHPGVNQPFLIATSNHLAALYENTSVLENHHWRSAMGCLIESNMAEQLGSSCAQLSTQISSLILATDITRQQEFLTRFKRYMDQDLLDMESAEYRHFILQIALKCADISNPCRPWDISKKWSQKVCEEFFRQGDYERQLSLPVTSMCDRRSTSISKIQAGFFRFVVAPLFQEWHRFLGTTLSTSMMGHLHGNKEKWDSMVVQENAEETKTEISDAEMIEEGNVSSEEDVCGDDASRSVELLLPKSPESVRRASLQLDEAECSLRVGRRHSVPLSLPPPPTFTRTIIRRESLAIGENRAHRRFPSGPISEEDDVQLCASLTSVLSSSSSNGPHHSSANNSQRERPVSAENLLPEPSIASITTSLEASRLSTVLQGGSPGPTPKGLLTRQQTFPPLAPTFMRHRYMSSAGADISEALDSRSSSSCSFSFSRQASEQTPEHRRGGDVDAVNRVRDGLFAIRDSTNRTLGAEECVPGKREQCEQTVRERGSKVAKISECAAGGQQRWEKENVDPRYEVEVDAAGNKSVRRVTPQGLARRRGSAPVGISHRLADDGSALVALRCGSDRLLRRGSVPTDVTRQSVLRGLQSQLLQDSECMASLPRSTQPSITLLDPSSTLPTGIRETGEMFRQRLDSTGNNFPEDANVPLSLNQQYPRRLSAPLDFGVDPSRVDVRWPSDNGSKSRSRKKRELRRRKSGGPEMFADVGAEASAWQRWARRQKDPVLARRRGSLPITLSGGNSPVEVAQPTELLAESPP